jgi:L-lysine 2,3-aminomutase
MRRKNDVWLDDAELEQIKQVADNRNLSVSAYLRRVGVREARDELLEQAANRRLTAQKQERELETFGYIAEPLAERERSPAPELTAKRKPHTDEPMLWTNSKSREPKPYTLTGRA